MTAPPTHKGKTPPRRARGIAMTRKTITQPPPEEAESALTDDELAEMEARHQPVMSDGRQFCVADGVIEWPCDAERLLDEVYEQREWVPKTWAGLAAILDTIYPEEVFPTLEDDPKRDLGPRVVSLLRLLTRERAEVERLQAQLEERDMAALERREY